MKKTMTFSIVSALVVSLLSITNIATASGTEDEQFSSQFSATAGLHGLELFEESGSRANVSLLTGITATGEKLCSSVSDANCAGNISFQAILEPCSTSVTVDCIDSVVAKNAAGQETSATFSQFFPAQGPNEFVGSPAESIPSGRSAGLWNIDGFTHTNGSLYQVAVQVRGLRVGGNATSTPRAITASITPVSLYQTDCNVQYHGTCIDRYTESVQGGRSMVNFNGTARDQGLGIRCVGWGEDRYCTLKHAFPAGMSLQLKLRLSTVPGGWLHGRMTDPNASIATENGVTTMIVEAAPTKVPAVTAVGQWSALPTGVQAWFTANCPGNCGTRMGGSLSLAPTLRNAISIPESFKESTFAELALWTDYINDKSSAMPSYWSVRTLSDSEMRNAPTCIANGTGVTGIVSSNSTLYSEGPPTFDVATKTLNYKVAAPHYMPDGVTEFLGRYDLLLRPDIASCLYGIDDLAVTSDVAVAAESGEAQAATTTMTRSADWFKFSAANYTHSAPTIKVKLTKFRPTLKMGKSLKVTTLAKQVSLKIPKGAKVVTSVSSASRKRCTMSKATTVKAIKKGSCKLTISITPKATKKVKKPKTIKRTVYVTIR